MRVEVRAAVHQYTTPAGVVHAVDGVDLDLNPGQMIALLGASGSGKTSLLNLIAGLDVPDSGSVVVNGITISDLSEAQRARVRLEHIGVVFQDDNLIAEFTARENIEIPLLARGIPLHDASQRADAALEELGIVELSTRLPAEMSGGQRQRVGIARALAGDQAVLLADEPTGALDSVASRALFERMANLAHEHGVSVLVATHDPLCTEYADGVTSMRDGRIIE